MSTITKAKWPLRFRNGLRPAISLIEVVVAVFLAGSLLVGVLLIMSSHARQARQLQLSRIGSERLDHFLWCWSQYDFRDEKLADVVQTIGLELHWPPGEPADTFISGRSDPVGLQITRVADVACLTWNLQKIRIEAVSTLSGDLMARVEIVRKARNGSSL